MASLARSSAAARAAFCFLKPVNLGAKPQNFFHAGDNHVVAGYCQRHDTKPSIGQPLQDDLGGSFGVQNLSGEILAAQKVSQHFDRK